jgi:uncharacterized protein
VPKRSAFGQTPLLAIGEAKWGEAMGTGHIERLRFIRSLLSTGGRYDTSKTKLMCFSGGGFSEGLRALAVDREILLVDADELYGFSATR